VKLLTQGLPVDLLGDTRRETNAAIGHTLSIVG
jgi:hypothetical protein